MENEMNNTNLNEGTETETNNTEDSVSYTADEVAKLVQSEADRRVQQALKKQQKEYEKKLSLSSLDEQQRKEAEKDMRIQELQDQLAAFQVEKNKSELKTVLSGRGLSAEFADIINISDDIEESQSRIDRLDKMFKDAVKIEVEKRLAQSGGTPKAGANSTKTLTKEDLRKMSIADKNALFETNPDLFNQLMG